MAARQARCSCGKLVPSDPGLAFFESRDEGTRAATESCKHCGYTTVAHLLVPTRTQRNVVAEGRCPGFEPKGAWEYDSYYCGHGGWD